MIFAKIENIKNSEDYEIVRIEFSNSDYSLHLIDTLKHDDISWYGVESGAKLFHDKFIREDTPVVVNKSNKPIFTAKYIEIDSNDLSAAELMFDSWFKLLG